MIRIANVFALLLFFVLASCSPGGTPPNSTAGAIDPPTTTVAAPDDTGVDGDGVLPDEPPSMVSTTIIDARLQAEITELIAITEGLRELTFEEPPIITVVSPAELTERVRAIIDEELDPDEIARDQALLESLGVLDGSVDLGDLYRALYAEQVQGFYDGDTGELVVPASPGGLDVLQRMVIVHELTHALADQAFGFHDDLDRLIEANDYERSAALRALVEGDATYTQALYFWQLPDADQAEGLILIEQGAGEALALTPSYLVDLLQFPYNEGARFATSLGTNGGFAALNAAYRNPPTTTEQIYDRERFDLAEPGIVVDLEPLTLDGYELAESGVWGRAGLEALFEPALGRQARLAAEGWGGDRYQVYWDGHQTVFIMSLIGDTDFETAEAYDGWIEFVDVQLPAGVTRRVGWVDDHVVVIISSDDGAVTIAAETLGVTANR